MHNCFISSESIANGKPPSIGWLLRFQHKLDGDPLEPSSVLPVAYEIRSATGSSVSASGTEFWTPLSTGSSACAARSGTSSLSTGKFKRQRGTEPLLANLDFENAFNSVDREAVWRWLS